MSFEYKNLILTRLLIIRNLLSNNTSSSNYVIVLLIILQLTLHSVFMTRGASLKLNENDLYIPTIITNNTKIHMHRHICYMGRPQPRWSDEKMGGEMQNIHIISLFYPTSLLLNNSYYYHICCLISAVHELEESCVRQGGLCVMKSDCPPENIVFLSGTLCPKQQHLGVTCCYVSVCLLYSKLILL